MLSRCVFLLFLTFAPAASASANRDASNEGVNPIRRVVGMLQMMEKKVQAEGEKEKQLFDKYMCYCQNGKGALAKSIADAETKTPQVIADIEKAVATKAQTEQELAAAQVSRQEAKDAIATATAVRGREAASFAKVSSDYNTNIAAMKSASAAVEKGMSGSFLQSSAANVLKQFVVDTADLKDFERDELTSFLSAGQGYSPQSGGITGILKQMTDTMVKNLGDATTAEETAIKDFDALVAAKTKEIDACTAAIETKTTRIGDLGVSIVQMKEDLDDTGKALVEDKAFLKDMDKNCAAKQAEWDEISKMRAEEMKAIAETIKLLNDDDALELFKKTLPSASFVQVVGSSQQLRLKALSVVRDVKRTGLGNKAALDLITLALSGKKVNFDKVLKMIDDLVGALKKEQFDDDSKKEYCEKQFDFTEDKKKALNHELSDLETAIAEASEGIATTTDELKTLAETIAALDKEVAEAAANRKEENEDYTALMAGDTAAKELLGMAKNRLNKFYNPKLYKPPPAVALVQIHAHRGSKKEAPAPPPESFAPYAKKAEMSGGVISMVDSIIADLDKEMTEAKATEQNSQADYETFVSDSAEQRAMAVKTVTHKEGVKADLENALAKAKSDQSSATKELMATEEYESSLHGDCDFLLSNFDMRKAAREGEVDSLKKAKAVLSGADFSLVQRMSARSLRGA